MSITIIAIAFLSFLVGYIMGHRNGFKHGLKQLDKLLSIPPGRGIDRRT